MPVAAPHLTHVMKSKMLPDIVQCRRGGKIALACEPLLYGSKGAQHCRLYEEAHYAESSLCWNISSSIQVLWIYFPKAFYGTHENCLTSLSPH